MKYKKGALIPTTIHKSFFSTMEYTKPSFPDANSLCLKHISICFLFHSLGGGLPTRTPSLPRPTASPNPAPLGTGTEVQPSSRRFRYKNQAKDSAPGWERGGSSDC